MTTVIRHQSSICVLYRSKYGSTEAYARELARRLGARIYPVETVTQDELKGVTRLIYGGAFRSGHILGAKRFFRVAEDFGGKIALFTTLMSVYDEPVMAKLRARIVPQEHDEIPLFYTRGRWTPSDMTFLDRHLLKGLLRSLATRASAELSLTEETLLGLDETPRDYLDMRYLEPLVRWAQGHDEVGVGRGVFQEETFNVMVSKLGK